jgi:hypothetical protein
VGPRRAILYRDDITGNYLPVGRVPVFVDPDDPDVPANPGDPDARITTVCIDDKDQLIGQPGNRNHICNNISDKDADDFADLEESDVIGGNKFISNTIEYRFPISEALGLQGIVFFDFGNAFGEGDNLFDVTEWRYGYGAGLQWFSPFGPLAVVLGFPLDPLSIEDSPVFEFSVGGGGF